MIIGVDTGLKGAVIKGTSLLDLEVVTMPQIKSKEPIQTIKEYEDFYKKNFLPGGAIAVERVIPASNLGGVRRAWMCGVLWASWAMVGSRFRDYFSPVPATWRKVIFGKGNLFKGDQWKLAEFYLSSRLFPYLPWSQKGNGKRVTNWAIKGCPSKDHFVNGIAAASLIWLYGYILRGGSAPLNLSKIIPILLEEIQKGEKKCQINQNLLTRLPFPETV